MEGKSCVEKFFGLQARKKRVVRGPRPKKKIKQALRVSGLLVIKSWLFCNSNFFLCGTYFPERAQGISQCFYVKTGALAISI